MHPTLRLFAPCLIALLALGVAPAIEAETPPAEQPAAFDLAAMFTALQAPTIVGEVSPAPAELVVGRAEIRPLDGARLLILSAGGHPCGYLLTGPATWRYAIAKDEAFSATEQRLDAAKGVEIQESENGVVLTGQLDGLAAWGWDLPDQLGDAVPASGALPTWLTEIMAQREASNPGRDMLQTQLNGDPQDFRWLLMHGAKDDFILDVDARPTVRLEVLSRLDKAPIGPLRGRTVSEWLARQPIGRDWQSAAELELLSTYTSLSVKNPSEEHLEVTAQVQVQAVRDDIELLSFALSSRVFDEHYHEHPYTVRTVAVDGKPAPWIHRHGSLMVLPPTPLKAGDDVALEVTVGGEVIVRPQGDKYWRLGLWNWYPKPAHGEEHSTFDIRFETHPSIVPIAPGRQVERTTSETSQRVVTHIAQPMGNIFLVAGEYTTVMEEMDGERIYASAYNVDKDHESQRVLRIMFAARACFERWFGLPYPFEDLQVVEVNQWGWGQAPPGIIFLTREAFLSHARLRADPVARRNAFMQRSLDARITHELAHAYFPHVAKVWRGEEGWLSESLADYTAAVCVSSLVADKPRVARRLFNDQLREWKDSSESVENGSVFFGSYQKNAPEGRLARYRLLYGRGPLVLHAVRLKLQSSLGEEEGDNMFFSWIRSYINIFQYKRAETRHLVGILERLTGEDWKPFFDRHIYGTEHIEIED